MRGKRDCLDSSQLHLSISVHRLSVVHCLPRQNSPCLSVYSTTTLADALGLPRDCRCEPRLVKGWQSQEAGRSWAVGLPLRCH